MPMRVNFMKILWHEPIPPYDYIMIVYYMDSLRMGKAEEFKLAIAYALERHHCSLLQLKKEQM